jgi:hypothetical protein
MLLHVKQPSGSRPRFGSMGRTMPGLLKWYVVYSDQPQTPVELEEPGDVLARFDIASMLGHIDGRKIKAMWIINHADEQDNVIRIHGAVPMPIRRRFDAAKRHRER